MLRIADKVFDSHLFTGTGKFASPQLMVDAIRESGSQLVTLALKRVDLRHHSDAILAPLLEAGVTLLPNTSGAKTAEEAIFAAQSVGTGYRAPSGLQSHSEQHRLGCPRSGVHRSAEPKMACCSAQ